MIGVEGVAGAVEQLLRANLNPKLAELRERYGVYDPSLEDIERYLTQEPENLAVDKPPMIVIAEQQTDTLQGPVRIAGDGSGGSVYRYRYTMAIFAWARGTTFATTNTARRRYGLAVREVLLQRPGIGPEDPGEIVIDPASIEETYSQIDRDERTREIIGATAISVDYMTQEYLSPALPPVGVAATGVVSIGIDPG